MINHRTIIAFGGLAALLLTTGCGNKKDESDTAAPPPGQGAVPERGAPKTNQPGSMTNGRGSQEGPLGPPGK